ncbi:MAG: hypothetical protein R3D80_08885 [Paracoccaceae bacterium]
MARNKSRATGSSRRDTRAETLGANRAAPTPSRIGTSATATIARLIFHKPAAPGTETEAMSSTSGRVIGAARLVTKVIATDRPTEPRARSAA